MRRSPTPSWPLSMAPERTRRTRGLDPGVAYGRARGPAGADEGAARHPGLDLDASSAEAALGQGAAHPHQRAQRTRALGGDALGDRHQGIARKAEASMLGGGVRLDTGGHDSGDPASDYPGSRGPLGRAAAAPPRSL